MRRFLLSLIPLFLIASSLQFVSSVADETLVLYLSFDEGIGKDIKDQSMYENDARIIANSEWVGGQSGGAVAVSGEAEDCVVIQNSESLQITGEITLMAWIKSAGWEGAGDQWIDKNCHDGDDRASYGMGVFENGTQTLFFLGNGERRPTFTVIGTPTLNQWQHTAATYDGMNMKIYINGKLQEGTLSAAEPGFKFLGNNDAKLRIGCAKNKGKYTFNGAIDEVVIYNRALDEMEVNNVMNKGPFAVLPEGKLCTTWSFIKGRYVIH